MKAKHKSILAGGLGALATVVWVPQLLSGADGEQHVAGEVSAELPLENEEAHEAGATAGEPVVEEEEPVDAPGPGEEDEPSDAIAHLASLEASLDALVRRDSGGDLAALLARLEAGDEQDAPEAPLFSTGIEPAPSGADASAWLEEFAAENPLTGLIHGPDRSAALLGHRVVRPGESLLGGRVTVVAIGSGWVELACEGVHLRVELPAFRARSSPRVSAPPLPASAPSDPEPAPAPAPVERGA